ncbi:LanC-like protein GCL1 [Tanacetum coccineum]
MTNSTTLNQRQEQKSLIFQLVDVQHLLWYPLWQHGIQDNVRWSLNSLPTLGLLISIKIFLAGTPFYRHRVHTGSPFTKMVGVILAALNKWKVHVPSNLKQLHKLDFQGFSNGIGFGMSTNNTFILFKVLISNLISRLQVFPHYREFKDVAIEAGEVVWKIGLLEKSRLADGALGNAYAFLALYHITGDTIYEVRAKAFGGFLYRNERNLITTHQFSRT